MSFGIWHFISWAGCNAIYLCFYCNARANNCILLVNLSVWTFVVVVTNFVRFIFTFASYAIQDSLHTVILSHCIHIHVFAVCWLLMCAFLSFDLFCCYCNAFVWFHCEGLQKCYEIVNESIYLSMGAASKRCQTIVKHF